MVTFPTQGLHLYRQKFPALTKKAYFNYGGQGTMPVAAISAIQTAHEQIQQMGPFSGEVNRWITQEERQTRQAIAAELETSAATITLTEDVTVGCNIALWGMNWQPGDHLLLTDCEHPGIVAAAQEIRDRFGVEVTTCPLIATLNQGDPVSVIARNLRPTTRLVVVSHILWNTGQVLPLKEIAAVCHAYPTPTQPVRLLVDAAQSVGMLPLSLDDLGVDFYAFTGHKWWCGPAGLGGLYVHPDAFFDLRPTFIGWRGITKNSAGYPTGLQPDGRRFEIATSDYTLYPALRAAIATHHEWGTRQQRYDRILQLSQLLWQQLSELPFITCLRTSPPESGLVSFQINDYQASTHHHLVEFLEQRGFLLRTILDPDCVRVCVHYFTLESEIDQLIQEIQKFQFNPESA